MFFACSPPATKEISTSEFILKEGFEIECVASEPLLDSPVAMTFDGEGRIWVVEMPGYMRDIDGRDEKLPDGRIVVLEDTDHDGRMDTRNIFIDSLLNPRAIALVYGGLLYTETPKLWWVPIDGNKPGDRVLVDSLYVVGGNIEHRPNGLLYNLDNWIYSAKSNARYRRINGEWIKEATTFRGQWGIAHDDAGRLFYNSNSTPLKADHTFPNQAIANPYFKPSYTVNISLDKERRLYPIQATAINRGYQKGNLDSLGRVKRFTSSCGPVVYRGDQFPADFQGNAFVCGPEANLVKRYLISDENGKIVAQPAYPDSEFLVSKDESFRPVNLYTGLDGALYILDLRKGVIQHRAYMTSYLRDLAVERGLDTINGIGRIYKVIATETDLPVAPTFDRNTPATYIPLLQHANGQVRSFAQQELIFGNLVELSPAIEQIALDAQAPYGQIHALWTLEGRQELTPAFLMQVATISTDPIVITQLLRLAQLYPESEALLLPLFQQAMKLESPTVDMQLSFTLGRFETPATRQIWKQLAQKYRNAPLHSEMLVSGWETQPQRWQETAKAYQADTLGNMLSQAIANQSSNKIVAPQFRNAEFDDNRTRGAQLYGIYCSACHGMNGKGIEELAPPLYDSEYVSESDEKLILIALYGLQGPMTVNGISYSLNSVMPGIGNNPSLSDNDIAVILRFVNNAFNSSSNRISEEKVKHMRKLTDGRTEPFTVQSLETWMKENESLFLKPKSP